MLFAVPISFVLRLADGRPVTLPDPGSGTFDAAGDFDGELCRSRDALEVLSGAMTHERRSYFGSRWVTMSPGERWKTTNLYPIEVGASKRARLPGRGKAAGSRETMRNDA